MGRWNGIPTRLVADACFGWNAYDLTAACFLGEASAWENDSEEAAPDAPPPTLRAHGRVVHLVCSSDGVLKRLRHGWRINRLRSLEHFEPRYRARGDRVRRTTCFNTCAGEAHLIHPDAKVVERDYRSLRRLQPTLFKVDTRQRPLYVRRGSVVRRSEAASSGRQLTSGQYVVDGLQLERKGQIPAEGSMAGIVRVRLLSAGREVVEVDVRRLVPPEWEIVAEA